MMIQYIVLAYPLGVAAISKEGKFNEVPPT